MCALVALAALVGCASGQASGQAAVAPGTLAATGAAASVSTGATPSPVAAGSVTRRVDLAPVDAQGDPAAGWTVGTMYEDAGNPIDCAPAGQPTPAPAAVSPDIYACAPSAATADTCWRAARPLRMLCLIDPFSRVVERFVASGTAGPVARPAAPVPLGLVLEDGSRCRLRDGGAWGSPAARPSDVGYYSCGQRRGIVWAPPGSPTGGIDRSQPRWTVEVGDVTGPLARVGVRTAYYVATAG
jgi:hypothetical protein